MTWWLNPKLWGAVALAAALAFAGWFLYGAGQKDVQAKWNAQKAADAQAVIDVNSENQRIANRWNATVIGALNAQTLRNQRLEADAGSASAERGRLLDAIRRATAKRDLPSTTAQADPEPANPIADVLGACTLEVQELARAADGHASDAQALSDAWPVSYELGGKLK